MLPNIALISSLKEAHPELTCDYIASKGSLDRQILEKAGIPFHALYSGKLRRYFSFKNILDTWFITIGFFQSLALILSTKPKVLFSKGGFVSLPVVYAAYICKPLVHTKIVIHESDSLPGLTTRLSARCADKVLVTEFFSDQAFLKKHKKKIVRIGIPLRKEFDETITDENTLEELYGSFPNLPTILFVGGSLGAQQINELVHDLLPELLTIANVIHVCGKGKYVLKDSTGSRGRYKQVEFINEEFPYVLRQVDLVVSRAGATLLYEIAYAARPSILLPLGAHQSRGEQSFNADFCKNIGMSEVVASDSEELKHEILSVLKSTKKQETMKDACKKLVTMNPAIVISDLLDFMLIS